MGSALASVKEPLRGFEPAYDGPELCSRAGGCVETARKGLADEFAGNDRFRILRRIGAGGMGVVYEARDEKLEMVVALKTMSRLDAAMIYRFKNEFRALTDVTHPNLVTLYDLFSEGDKLFFTMELVEGVDFLRHVRFGGAQIAFAETLSSTPRSVVAAPTLAGPSVASASSVIPASVMNAATGPRSMVDLDALRRGLQQLAEGVFALHSAGKLHRDIKPSNVLVTPEGRVVLLDFGLVTELAQEPNKQSQEQAVAGTAEYMSPEQAMGATLTEASDWYSVGVMLYEALTGALPFDGPRLKLLMDKQQFDPRAPRELAEVPNDLDALCVSLLKRRPEDRPRAREILAALGTFVIPRSSKQSARSMPTMAAPFVGREQHLEVLEQAFVEIRAGRTVAVDVHGSSGMGKTLLVRRFLDSLVQRNQALVLRGRCYERESVPFKALDSVVDDLTRYLARLSLDEVSALMPREVLTLARVVPVLRRIEAIARAPKPAHETPDPQELRRRAFGALREMMARIADRRPLVLWIDDMQWGDVDSAAMIGELLRPPDAPPLLLVATYRSGDVETSAALRALIRARATVTAGILVHDVEVGPLGTADAESLARMLLGDSDSDDAIARAIAAESGGSPYFVDELVRFVQSGAGLRRSSGRMARLDDVIADRVGALPEAAQRLLETVAVAGRPLGRAIAARASELGGEEERVAVAVLRTGHLLRTVTTGDREALETYHDRIRETVVDRLPPERLARHHEQLARALEGSSQADPEALAVHFRGADDRDRAAHYSAIAAGKAADALAFDRAAVLYRNAIELHAKPDSIVRRLQRSLGDALANAGRGSEAAAAYSAAAEGSPAADTLELKRRAAEELLRSGHIDEGLEAIRIVLGAVGMKLPESRRSALLSLGWSHTILTLRGLGFKERDATQIPADVLTKIDICWSVGTGLAIVDHIRARSFTARHLLLAVRAGEKMRIARGFASEVLASAVAGVASSKRVLRLATMSDAMAKDLGSPQTIGFADTAAGSALFLLGRWREALTRLDRAIEVYRDQCVGVAWEASTTKTFALWSLYFLGRIADFMKRRPEITAEARERGDLFLLTNACVGINNVYWLVLDDPDRADVEVDEAIAGWSHRDTHLQHYYVVLAHAQTALYRGDGAQARAIIDAKWSALSRAFIFKVEKVYLEALHLRARASLASARNTPTEAKRLLAHAAADARRIERSRAPWAQPYAHLIRAGIAASLGDVRSAIALLESAEKGFVTGEMGLYATVSRRRRGELLGNRAGQALVTEVDATMRAESIENPTRFAEMLAPGFQRLDVKQLRS